MANFASSKNINIMDVSALGQDKEEDDFQLLSAIAENMDTAAFTRLYGKYAKWAFGLFYSRTGSKEAASELSQNLWMYVWDNAGKIIGNHDEKTAYNKRFALCRHSQTHIGFLPDGGELP